MYSSLLKQSTLDSIYILLPPLTTQDLNSLCTYITIPEVETFYRVLSVPSPKVVSYLTILFITPQTKHAQYTCIGDHCIVCTWGDPLESRGTSVVLSRRGTVGIPVTPSVVPVSTSITITITTAVHTHTNTHTHTHTRNCTFHICTSC